MLVERSEKNPVLIPKRFHAWEATAVFNGCPIREGKNIYLLYRALSLPHYHNAAKMELVVSNIGIAKSSDGISFHDRRCLISPEESWERFGCEDPRITKLNNKYYVFYTALSMYPFQSEGIKVGLAITKDLKTIDQKHLITPFNAKGMALFPEKINGKMWAVLTVNTDKPPAKICLASFNKEEEIWSEDYWQGWYKNTDKNSLQLQRRPQDQIEVGAPPIKTKHGWLLIYSYITNYFSPHPVFGVEAVLLDLKNPHKIIGKTKAPLFSPEEYYEKIGLISNIVFPSGALLERDVIHLYYGAADTTCCLAFIDAKALFKKLLKNKPQAKFVRAKTNPVLSPIHEHFFEKKAVFNPAAIYLNRKVHIIYRAMSDDNTSVFGYATSKDGVKFDYRSPEPIYFPRESFEQKLTPGANSGCEDPRITKIGNKIYITYTAYDSKNPTRVALTWIKESDFVKQKWNFAKSVLISPPNIDDKNACIFPEKINGKYFIIHRIGNDINSAFSPTLDFDNTDWLEGYRWVYPRKGMWDSKRIGIAAPPIKTKMGWLLLYHGISEEDNFYRVGAILVDLKDPTKILSRSEEPLLEPEMPYEKEGLVSNVVFPCGAVLLGKNIFIYYGGADRVIGVASMKLKDLLGTL